MSALRKTRLRSKAASQPKAEILTVGDELLKGSTLNTNARFLGRELTSLGFVVAAQTACPDKETAIRETLAASLERSRLVIMTGGLGPTPDDVTREGVAAYFDVTLKFSQRQYDRIVRYYRVRKKRIPASVRKEALFPANAIPLENKFGIALGFYLVVDDRMVVVLPGVPREMERMFQELVRPLILRRFKSLPKRHLLVVRTIGLSEPEIMQRLGVSFFEKDFDFGIYPYPGEAAIRIHTATRRRFQELKYHMKRKMRRNIYAFADVTLAQAVGDLLVKAKCNLAVAESCSGGQLAAELVAGSGASAYFQGGIVAYHNAIKMRELGVLPQTLKREGAVSEATAKEMALGMRSKFKTDYALSITGIAGPEGGTPAKPVGTVCIGLSTPLGDFAWRHLFAGDREHIQRKSVQKALEYLWRELTGLKSKG